MIPALIPSCRAWVPRVAETWVWEISFRLIGRAPICSVSASSWASEIAVKPPEIWAPVRPSIPSGFSWKLMIGRVLTSLSRTTAKWPESASACSWLGQPDRLFLAALGDLAGDFVEGFAARVGEFEDDDRFAEFVRFLFRVGDFFAAQRRVVDQRVPARFGAFDRRALLSAAVRRRRPSRPGP